MALCDDCLFCKIVRGLIPSSVIFYDDYTMCFMDINPVAPGHCLVIPKFHCVRFSELPEQYASAIALSVRRAAVILEKAGFEHYNILNNNGELSGQVVKHVHVHLIPKTAPNLGLLGTFAKAECDVQEEYKRLLSVI